MKKPKEKEETGDNHNASAEVLEAVASIRKEFQDAIDRMQDLADKKDAGGQAQLFVVKSLLDTDRKHLPEMTRLYLRSVRPCSLADMSSSVLDPSVQAGIVTLGQVRRESVYRHMRSVGGDLINKISDLALEQLRVTENQEPVEGAELGKGL